jgi:hypothetical protein
MSPSTYKFLADALVIFHMTFVAFVFLGAFLVLRWRWVAFLHVPSVMWVIFVETTAGICPLTPLENELRDKAGIGIYEGGFVDHYIMPVLYPAGLTPDIQLCIGLLLALTALRCYESVTAKYVWRRTRRRRLHQPRLGTVFPGMAASAAMEPAGHVQ